MLAVGFQMFGFVSSVLATVFFIPTIHGWLRDAMPSAKMRHLDALLSETEALLRSALEEGTIDYRHYDVDFSSRIWAAKLCADEYRAQVYTINSRWHELVHWMGGLSGNIATSNDLCIMRGQIAWLTARLVSSSRGRQRLNRMGHTTNPTLEKYAQRETLSILTLPNARLPCTIDMFTHPDKSAVPLSTEHVLDASAPTATHLSVPAPASPANLKARALPPLAFRSKEKAALGTRRVERVVLHRAGKHSPSVNSAQTGHKERRGFPGPFRIFSGIFQRSSATLPAAATTSSVTASLLTPSSSEKGIHLHTAAWEVNGHVAVQVKLPV
ncbi:hypothetical protein C8T65DRAFT_656992 [Cerioporus squamosus]|nr:hypothetical protein C8T65DRAFT_656992 [Cerioporus squamosus]